ncbi:ABC transporter permease [Anoxynatronum buryatiense]|uniref:Iron(III) transport system permease protein n=1 Tax=Anoxynatronum buryatiense TaxID=489973 RepID=A0AA46AKF9_9CLOT|nr:iron ABC transporter permease [Anoxynatronum buryatiense]SMP70678.1 iron(III) transport system permease protein [Anoxynatronum buryatiense]
MNRDKVIKSLVYTLLFYLVAVFVVFPIGNTIWRSLQYDGSGFSFHWYVHFFSTPTNLMALRNTITVGIFTVAACLVVGVSMAFYTSYFKTPFQRLTHMVMLSAVMLPGVMIVIAFIQLYAEMGIINHLLQTAFHLVNPPLRFSGFWGILFVHSFTQYIYFYINTKIAIAFIDYSLVESARNLGASRWQVFKDVLLPHLAPALVTSALMTFATGVSSFSAPYLIGRGYRMMSTQILHSKMNNQMSMAAAQVTLLMVLVFMTMGLYSYYNHQSFQSRTTKTKKFRRVRVRHPVARGTMHLVAGIITALIMVPIVGVMILSFADSSRWMTEIIPSEFGLQNYRRILAQPRVLDPIINSLKMSLQAGLMATAIGAVSAFLVLRNKGMVSRWLHFLVLLPMAIPASTLGVNMILAFNRRQWFLFNQSLIGTYWILPITYVLAGITIASKSIYSAFENFNREYEQASRNLGATRTQTFIHVFMPMVSAGIISAFSLVVMRSLGEYTISALLYGVHNRPVSIAMVNALHDYDIGISMAYGGIVIFIGMVILGVITLLDPNYK